MARIELVMNYILGSQVRKIKAGGASPKGTKLGVQIEGVKVAASSESVGFNVGLGRKSKNNVVGLKSLDSKHHSVVVIFENHDPNVVYGDNTTSTNSLGFKNLISSSSLPSSLQFKMSKDKFKIRVVELIELMIRLARFL